MSEHEKEEGEKPRDISITPRSGSMAFTTEGLGMRIQGRIATASVSPTATGLRLWAFKTAR